MLFTKQLVLVVGLGLFLLTVLLNKKNSGAALDTDSQTCSADDLACFASTGGRRSGKPLRPHDLPSIRLYSDWKNSTLELSVDIGSATKTTKLNVATGRIKQAGYFDSSTQQTESSSSGSQKIKEEEFVSEFSALANVATREEVSAMLKLLRDPSLQNDLDGDPDTVDGFATQEFFLDNEDLRAGRPGKTNIENPEQYQRRIKLRSALTKIVQPILDERITPYVNHRYAKACKSKEGRSCKPCYSLIRRYLEGERQSHAPHRDGHALVSVVVSLSDYGTSYTGGLYVGSASGQPYYLGLNQGDAAVHQSDLLHGVKVKNGNTVNEFGKRAERWSWILWFRDSESLKCEDYGYEWFVDCARQGNPTCEMLYSTKVSATPGLSKEEKANLIVDWNIKAANHGHPTACVKLARAYLGLLPSSLTRSEKKAKQMYQRAIRSSNDPDAHYELVSLFLIETKVLANGNPNNMNKPEVVAKLDEAVSHLEQSALGGHPFAMFNMGMVHLFGYGSQTTINHTLAGDWFEVSGIPEGLAARAMYYNSVGDMQGFQEFQRRATSLGYGSQWRLMARAQTGNGGASGVDLNLPWPPNENNQMPPKW